MFDLSFSGIDERGSMWSIPQGIFEEVSDGLGNLLPLNVRYAAYVNFINFHNFNDILTRPMMFGKGIQDLVEIFFMSLAATRRVIKDFRGVVPKSCIDFKYHNYPSIG